MNKRKQDDLTRALLLCGSVPFGILALVALIDVAGQAIGALIGVMR